MAITFIEYTKQQRRNMAVSGYSIYINGSFLSMYETFSSANSVAVRYPNYNDIEIYPVLTRRYKL